MFEKGIMRWEYNVQNARLMDRNIQRKVDDLIYLSSIVAKSRYTSQRNKYGDIYAADDDDDKNEDNALVRIQDKVVRQEDIVIHLS